MKFGDIITYHRSFYKHYAVYTGKNEKGQDTVFEFTGEKGSDSKKAATAKEGLLKPGGEVTDYITKLQAQPETEMRKTIDQLKKKGAGQYNLITNNCEHLATYIHYGQPMSRQADLAVSTQSTFNNTMAENMGASFKP